MSTGVPGFPFVRGAGLAPPAEYAGLHEGLARVVLPGGRRAALAGRYDDVRTVLGDQRFSRAGYGGAPLFARTPESLALVRSDAPEHTRRRRAVTSAFSARRAERARPALESSARELIAAMLARGPLADLVDDFAVPFTLAVICDLLGVPAGDRAGLRPWVDAMMSTSRFPAAEVAAAHEHMHAYFTRLVDRIRAGPDPENVLAHQGVLSRDEAVVMGAGLLMAGYETTGNQLAVCAYLLLRERERWLRLRADPAGVPAAVEEILRWTPLLTTGITPHVAMRDVELSAGVVRRGDVIVPLVDAANRDPAVFAAPAELDLTRAHNPHVAFGHGRHFCLGAHLARVELQVALTCLLRELPDLALASPGTEPPWRRGMFISGVWHLPVRLHQGSYQRLHQQGAAP